MGGFSVPSSSLDKGVPKVNLIGGKKVSSPYKEQCVMSKLFLRFEKSFKEQKRAAA